MNNELTLLAISHLLKIHSPIEFLILPASVFFDFTLVVNKLIGLHVFFRGKFDVCLAKAVAYASVVYITLSIHKATADTLVRHWLGTGFTGIYDSVHR